MSNKHRNRQPIQVNTSTQDAEQATQDAAQQQSQEDQSSQENTGSEEQQDQTQQDQSQDDTGTEQQQQSDEASGDQAAEKEVVQEPVQEKAVAKTVTPTTTTQQEGFTPVYKVQLDLANYAEAMDKKKSIVPEEGGKWQYSLYTTIKGVLNAKDQEEFNKEWNTALMFFNQNKDGIFNENFLFRFPEQWPGSGTEFTSFRRIAYMMLQTADAKTRKKALKDINMELVVEGLNQAQRTKLLNFYEA